MTAALRKSSTGVSGLDEITGGGLPSGRTTLVLGGPGTGKTLLSIQFLVAGATEQDEPGVFVSFEESHEALATNVAALGWSLDDLRAEKKLVVEHFDVGPADLAATGPFDLEGIFARLGHAIDSVGAKRVVLDTIDVLFAAIEDHALLRSELRRLFLWLSERGVTSIVTAERGERDLTRFGLEEYVSDCVIVLTNRVRDQLSTRLLRILKYRGSSHGQDEYPFLIDEQGFSVLPTTVMTLEHEASDERVSTGIDGLDEMLGGGGIFRGSSVLISGVPGAGKTSIVARYAEAAVARGERTLHLAFEESSRQIVRNMRSIGVTLDPVKHADLYRVVATRPSAFGLETHLTRIFQAVRDFEPLHVVMDPLSAMAGPAEEVESALIRLVDFLKTLGATAIMTSLASDRTQADRVDLGISSLIDTWLLVSNHQLGGERNRAIEILKSRGMSHSNQVREFVLSDDGIAIVDVYAGEGQLLMGTARASRLAEDDLEAQHREELTAAKRRRLEHRRKAVDAQIAALRAELETEAQDLAGEIAAEERKAQALARQIAERAQRRERLGGGGLS